MNFIKFDEYQKETKRTSPNEIDPIYCLLNFSMGLSGEASEVVEIIHDFLFGSPLLDKNKLAKELGDVMWYIARASEVSGKKLSDLAGISRIDAFQLIHSNEIFEIERDTLRNLTRLSMKLVSITGVITDHMKKVQFQGHVLDCNLIHDKLDDALILVSQIAYVIECKFSTILDMNVFKLRKRYPDGFKISDSKKRVDEE